MTQANAAAGSGGDSAGGPRGGRAAGGTLHTRILDAFAARARVASVRGVVMAEVARDLGISTKTLYRVFASKEDLVHALMERWATHLETSDRSRREEASRGTLTLMREWAEEFARGTERFSPAFWAELERDYPEAYRIYEEAVAQSRERNRRALAPLLRSGIPADYAHELFDAVTAAATDPEVCERVGLSRREAVVIAVELWAAGALRSSARRPPRRARPRST